MPPSLANTIPECLRQRLAEDADRVALLVKRSGEYHPMTWSQFGREVYQLADALLKMGLVPGDRVAHVSENRHEWMITDLALHLAGLVHVPIHAPLSGPQIAWQIRDSGARCAIVSCAEQASKLVPHAGELSREIRWISYHRCDARRVAPLVITPFDELVNLENAANQAALDRSASELDGHAARHVTPESLATILYTSGTTGEPKGVMLTQRNLLSNAVATCNAFGQTRDEIRLGILPLSHIYARTCDLYCWLVRGSRYALTESRETTLADAAQVKPTTINAVPYFYDKVMRLVRHENEPDQAKALRDALGGAIVACFSGGAPLPDAVYDFYAERGLTVMQGYGMTESSPVISATVTGRARRGSVGQAIDGVEVRIDNDGEVITRGPHVMAGYWNNPAATAETIRDGWLHTGDLGRLDEDGYLYITGRKKEIIVTSLGKKVVPVQLENLLTQDPFIIQALVIGEGRKYLTALIVPNPDALRAEIKRRRLWVWSKRGALAHRQVQALYRERIDHCLSGLSAHEQIKRFTLLDRGLTMETGEMTPKLTLRRGVIETNFREAIEQMYRD